jgi:phosphomannomutase
MPEISRFFGIAIAIYYDDREPPLFYAFSGVHRIAIDIETGATSGHFPPRALGLVLEWRLYHVDELRQNWRLARERRPLRAIEPLE